MTKLDEYYADMERVWSAIIVVFSMAGTALLVMACHLIGGRG